MDTKEKNERLQSLYREVQAVTSNKEATKEEMEAADLKLKEALDLREEIVKDVARDASMKNLEAHFASQDEGRRTLPDTGNQTTPDKWDGFKGGGDFLRAVRYGNDARLKRETKDLAESGGPSGGFLAPEAFDAQLREVIGENSVVRPRATVIPMTTRSVRIPCLDQSQVPTGSDRITPFLGGVMVEWTEEAAEKPTTEPKFQMVELVAHKMTAYTRASDELLSDSAIALEALLTRLLGGAVSWNEDYADLRGDGVGKPLGVLNSPALKSVTRAGAGQISYADIVGLMTGMLPGANPVWLINPSVLPELYTLVDGLGQYIWHPNVSEGVPGTVLGVPVVVTEKLPLLGAVGDILLADFSYYLIGDRQGTTIASSEHERFRYDQTSWRVVSRVDGQPWLKSVLRLNDGTTTISPFVALTVS